MISSLVDWGLMVLVMIRVWKEFLFLRVVELVLRAFLMCLREKEPLGLLGVGRTRKVREVWEMAFLMLVVKERLAEFF